MIKSFAVAALLAVSASATAQFTNGSSSSSSTANTDGWSTIWVQYNASSFKYDVKNADDQSFNGLSFGYSQAFSVAQNMPLFVEAGFGVQYSFYTEDMNDYSGEDEIKFNMFSAKVPVNLIYKFDLPNSNISLMPFVGAKIRYNLSAKLKYEFKEDGYEDDDYYDMDTDIDLFDKKEADNPFKRMQLGWQIGLKARFNNSFLVGLSYGSDFSEIAKKTKVGGLNVTLGYTF